MKKNIYVQVDATVHLAARQRALAEAKTLGQIVEEALRALLGVSGAT